MFIEGERKKKGIANRIVKIYRYKVPFFLFKAFFTYVYSSIKVSKETSEDQKALEHYPSDGSKDRLYHWIREGTKGATGMPLNVQVRDNQTGLRWSLIMIFFGR
jgi:hypothetical protein